MLVRNGTRVPLADNEVTLSVSGNGRFIGEERIKLEGGRCVFIVQSKCGKEGIITCRAEAEGLTAAECMVKVTE